MSKAFDIIDHTILLRKLQIYVLEGIALNWFMSYLENCRQVVEITYTDKQLGIINNKLSYEKPIKYGVPQGSILGPALFLLYINDLKVQNTHRKLTFFADDTSILITGKIKIIQKKILNTQQNN